MALGIKTKSPAISYKYPWEDPAYRAQYATPGVGSSVQVEGGQEWRTDPDSPNSGSAPVEMTMDQAKGKYISDWLWANNPEFKSATLDLAPSKQLRGVWGKATTTPSGVFKKGVGGTGWAYIDDSIAKLENPSAIFTLPPELGGRKITPRQNITYKRDDPDFMDKAMSVAAPILGFMAGGPLGAAVGGAAGADTMGGNPLKGALIAGGASMLPGVLKNTFNLSPPVAAGVTGAAKTAFGGGDLSDVLKSGTLGYGIPTVGKDFLGLTPGSPVSMGATSAIKTAVGGGDFSDIATSGALGYGVPTAWTDVLGQDAKSALYPLYSGVVSTAARGGDITKAAVPALLGAGGSLVDSALSSAGVAFDTPTDSTDYWNSVGLGYPSGGGMDDYAWDAPLDSADYWNSVGLGYPSDGFMNSADYWAAAGLPVPGAGTFPGVDLSAYGAGGTAPGWGTTVANILKSVNTLGGAVPGGLPWGTILGAGAGALGSNVEPITQSAAPWSPAQAYMLDALAKAKGLSGTALTLPQLPTLPQLDPTLNDAYIDAAVRAAMRPAEDMYSEVIMPSIAQNAIGAGGRGSARQGVAEGVAAGKLARATADTSAEMRQAFSSKQADDIYRTFIANTGNQQWTYGAGAQRAQDLWASPWTSLMNYGNLANTSGGQGRTSSIQMPSQSPWVAALGGGIAGSQLQDMLSKQPR